MKERQEIRATRMTSHKSTNKIIGLELFFIFVFYLVIARLLIHSGDDWAWGSEIGINRMKNYFDNYNGRYVGNIVEIIITRSMVARLLIYAFVNTSIIYVLYLLTSKKFNPLFLFLPLLLMPVTIYQETYGWLAGFANYNVSTLLVLSLLYLVTRKDSNVWSYPVIFILSFLGQFFVENVSIATMFMAFVGMVIAFAKKEKIMGYLIWLISSVIGFIIMFSNSAYHADDNMRGLSNIDFSVFVETLITTWSEFLIKENALLLILFAFTMYYLSKKSYLSLATIAISSYFFVRQLMNIDYTMQHRYILLIEFGLIIIYVLAMIVIVSKTEEIKLLEKIKFFYILLFSVVLVGPFLILTPFGPRNILTSYVLLLLCLFILLKPEAIKIDRLSKPVLVICLSTACLFISLHTMNKIVENKRVTQLKSDVRAGSKEVEFMRLPFEFLGHDLTPKDGGVQSKRQKKYHHISLDVKFNIIDFKSVE